MSALHLESGYYLHNAKESVVSPKRTLTGRPWDAATETNCFQYLYQNQAFSVRSRFLRELRVLRGNYFLNSRKPSLASP